MRTFRIDRIEGRLTTGARYVPREPPARDLAAYVFQGGWYAAPCRARIKLLVGAQAAAERLPACIGLVEPIDEQSCFFDTGASTFEILAMHLALMGVDFEITEAGDLVNQVRRIEDRYRKATAQLDPRTAGLKPRAG